MSSTKQGEAHWPAIPLVSVIIPTYNRKKMLGETLASLNQQTWPADNFEVILVDDGSTDGTEDLTAGEYIFPLRYIRQANQGDAAARNTGFQASQADLLVFIDDDILVEPDYLFSLVREHGPRTNRIVVGTEILWLDPSNPLEHPPAAREDGKEETQAEQIEFSKVCSNNMSIKRTDYQKVGMMDGLDFPGSSIWCDVDFAYRAHLQGIEFVRSPGAVCWHRDYVSRSLDNRKERMRKAAFRAIALFEKHPALLPYLDMFADKTPINWQADSPRLILRKLLRAAASSRPVLWLMVQVASVFSRLKLPPEFMRPLSRWIIGGYIYLGYREGLRELKG